MTRDKTTEDIWKRLGRMETRLVSGFEQLGANPCTKLEGTNLRVDEENCVVYAEHPSLTIGAIIRKLDQVNAPQGTYRVVCPECRPLSIDYNGEEKHE